MNFSQENLISRSHTWMLWLAKIPPFPISIVRSVIFTTLNHKIHLIGGKQKRGCYDPRKRLSNNYTTCYAARLPWFYKFFTWSSESNFIFFKAVIVLGTFFLQNWILLKEIGWKVELKADIIYEPSKPAASRKCAENFICLGPLK